MGFAIIVFGFFATFFFARLMKESSHCRYIKRDTKYPIKQHGNLFGKMWPGWALEDYILQKGLSRLKQKDYPDYRWEYLFAARRFSVQARERRLYRPHDINDWLMYL